VRIESPLSSLLDGLDPRIALLDGASDEAGAITKRLPMSPHGCRIEARIALADGGPYAALAVLDQCDPSSPVVAAHRLRLL